MGEKTKVIFTLNIDNYAPEITEVTYPYIKLYADKIGAEFRIINERKWPEAPATYEKLQIFEEGRPYDWVYYIDSDALIHPDMFDLTSHIHPDTVLQYGNDLVGTRFRDNRYFRRDTRRISSCNWFTVASNDCLDLWHPLEDMTVQEALSNIRPQLKEIATCSDGHLIDDYVLSLNIAKYGLRYTTFHPKLLRHLGMENAQFFFHTHLLTREEKAYVLPRIMEERWKKALPVDLEWLEKTLKALEAEEAAEAAVEAATALQTPEPSEIPKKEK
jgi:hypothetical protein